jgi:hypothetical protein
MLAPDVVTDYVLQFMVEHNIPLTRENYLDIAFMGSPDELDAEEEFALPEMLQLDPQIDPEEFE